MSEPVIAREVAEAEVKKWIEILGSDQPDEVVTEALMEGRIVFDEKAETFLMSLRSPIALDNGSTIRDLRLAEPTALQLKDASKATKEEMEITIRLLAYVSGIEGGVGVMQRLKQRDLLLAGALLGFFA